MRDAVYKDMFAGLMFHSSLGCQTDHTWSNEIVGGKLQYNHYGNTIIRQINALFISYSTPSLL